MDESENDSVRVRAFKFYIWDGYLFNKTDSAYIVCDQLYAFSEEKGYKEGMAQALDLKGIIASIYGNFSQALSYYQQSLKLSEEVDNKKGLSATLNNMGLIYQKTR